MKKQTSCINPRTGEPIQRTKNILVYGITNEQFLLISENLPSNDVRIIDCSDCFTDIIATAYIAVIINPDCLTDDNIKYFNELAKELGCILEKIVFTKPHAILDKLNRNVPHITFADDFEFADKIKFTLLEANRTEKRATTYSETISQTIKVLSEIRKHPYITTAELAEIIERNPRTVQRYITTLICAGEAIDYDRKKKGWFLMDNKSLLWGDY